MIKQFSQLADLKRAVSYVARRFNLGSFLDRMEIDALPRTEYAYSLYWACLQAKALGYAKVSAIEFGVAGGHGLLLLESHAEEVENLLGIAIETYGFDTSEGMPMGVDHRDLPYAWGKGFFKMDFGALTKRLKRSKLIIGNVEETIDSFGEVHKPAPIGFVSIDVDYYSSTKSALRLFDEHHDLFLPRVYCYCDDLIGNDWELHSEFTGEALAIHEFNADHAERKLGRIHGLRHKRLRAAPWNDSLFVLHLFKHPKYCLPCPPREDWQLPLAN
jgi:hypothetical protein